MRKAYTNIVIIILIMISLFIPITGFCEESKDNKVIKVGFYEYYPYYFTDDNGKIDGYYHELMELISYNLDIEYEYVNLKIKDCVKSLKEGKIDLLFGVEKSPEKEKDFLFSKNAVAREDVSVYTNKNLESGKISQLENLKLGYIKNESNHQWFIDLLSNKNIKPDLIELNTYKELENEFINGRIDSIIQLSNHETLEGYKKIYDFSIDQLYILASRNQVDLIEGINDFFDKSYNKSINPISNLYKSYFKKDSIINEKFIVTSIVLSFIIILTFGYIAYKKIRRRKIYNKARNIVYRNMKDNNYVLYYQPIVDPKRNKIKGFEGLLRLNKNGEIISPYFFIKDIESAGMMKEVSLWILDKAIRDYTEIRDTNEFVDKQFYISINLSFREIEDIEFVKVIIEKLVESGLDSNSICLEIVEKFGINDLKKVQLSVEKLKRAGFLVAIDDFGVEYSNLDIIEKINFNIIKLDKYFIDNIEQSYLRKEIVRFIANICEHTGRIVVVEGIEKEDQKNFIKKINNNKFYIQGYYYSKPLPINEISNIKI